MSRVHQRTLSSPSHAHPPSLAPMAPAPAHAQYEMRDLHPHSPAQPFPVSFNSSQTYLGAKPSMSDSLTDIESATDIEHPLPSPAHLPPDKPEPKKGVWERLVPNSMACRLYLLIILIETTIDIAIEADILIRVQATNLDTTDEDARDLSTRRLPVYLIIFALAHVFQFLLALDAVHQRNTLQFIFLAIFNALFLVYSVIQITEVTQALPASSATPEGISHIPIKILITAIPIVISIAEIAYIVLGWKIYMEFGWKVYKLLGADRRVKQMYAHYQIFSCLVRFDVFFWFGFSIQLIRLVLLPGNFEYYLTIAACPLSLLLLLHGHYAARRENKWMMGTFVAGCVLAMSYFVYKLVRIWQQKDGAYRFVFKSLSVFAAASIFLLLITFVSGCIVYSNFGAGLKFHMSKKKGGEIRRNGTVYHPGGRYQGSAPRMSIE
ncbi:hypothetical protein BOTBODRAFT_56603 [Botryobasidium botryosum FD-172 SS1]|uniref:Uncharacterized protein n=1 Tax=Botryobasidium botryosum (strain FD-172 SS1) TaxID=930990 RepID=A0A067MMP4_BOTB1|nr:hypothetical protein BOTBODRAFT_56603 [Botryobasidium botryosum FD-172 SS1]